MSKKITLKQIQLKDSINNTSFLNAYKKLILGSPKSITENEKLLLLKFAIIFLNYGERSLEKFGYKIILGYSNLFDDYVPLYDVAINKDYIPVAKMIEGMYCDLQEIDKNFHRILMSAYKDNFKHHNNGEVLYHSAGQKRQYLFSKSDQSFIIVAPTSYGKSELIIHKVEDNLDKNICIIVPTKSLLAQTKTNLIKNYKINASQNRIITHPDMLNDISENFIAVLTQERLLRLLQKYPDLNFDVVLIDEAHNIIEDNSREILTVHDLKILKTRNNSVKMYYFTPFFVDPKKLKVFSNEALLFDKIHEHIKIEKYFVLDLTSNKKMLKIYDQFINDFYNLESLAGISSTFEFIKKYSANKNIIYLNRPKHIEQFSLSIKNDIHTNISIEKVKDALKDFLHKDYNLIKTIENGVVYHHGGMPENIRSYVENAFSQIQEIKYIVTTSTLLQGVNIPAEKLFLLDTKKGIGNLNAAQFKNLSGRICRFSEIFNKNNGNLKLLEPEIYIIKNSFSNKKANIEKGSSNLKNLRTVKSIIAKECFKNNIHDFDIFENEEILVSNFNENLITNISTSENLVNAISNIFIRNIKFRYNECSKFRKKKGKPYNEKGNWVEKPHGTYCNRPEGHYVDKNCNYCRTDKSEFIRLKNEKAKKFYQMFLTWRTRSASYKEMIFVITKYWDNLPLYTKKLIYVGSTWGEIKKQWKNGGGWKKLYVNLTEKKNSEIINLAIAKIKEEQDFIDFRIIPYVEILNKLELLDSSFYDKIKYGTDNQIKIKMLKEGFSMELVKLIISEEYANHIQITDSIIIKNTIVKKMSENHVNPILIHEIKYYVTS